MQMTEKQYLGFLASDRFLKGAGCFLVVVPTIVALLSTGIYFGTDWVIGPNLFLLSYILAIVCLVLFFAALIASIVSLQKLRHSD